MVDTDCFQFLWKFSEMTFKLTRERDGAGDSGPMLLLIKCFKNKEGFWEPCKIPNKEGFPELIYEHGIKPKIGYCVRVGSIIARSYQMQDYWTTTPVEEILEEGKEYIKFRTTNSIYTLTGPFK